MANRPAPLNLSSWAMDFCLWLHQFPDLLNVFLGATVHKTPNVKLEASAGCQLYDWMFAQANVMYGLESAVQGHWPAPNEDFVAMWDRVAEVHNSLSKNNLADLGRQWNNKGNSMEALTLPVSTKRTPSTLANAFRQFPCHP